MTEDPAIRARGWRIFAERFAASLACGFLGTVAQAAIPAYERAALLDLYSNTNGADWKDNAGWDGPPGSACSWYGVVCDKSGKTVNELQLAGNHLVGTLPADLSQLIHLRTFFVGNNQLDGEIPSLYGLAELRDVAVGSNLLSGSLPALGELPQLVSFDCGNNALTGGIPPLSTLSNLQALDLSDNHLSGSVPALTTLSNLQVLNLSDNALSGTLPSLAGMTQLQYVYLAANQFTGPPPEPPRSGSLAPGGSTLCVNYFDHVASPAWDIATGVTPWYQNCPAWNDTIFVDGFDGSP